MKVLSGPLRLVPVVELEPWDVCPDRPWPPDVPLAVHWRACLDAVGLPCVTPLAPTSMAARLELLGPAGLDLLVGIVERRSRDEDAPGAPLQPDHVCGLRGGLALEAEGALHVEPNCCADLGDWAGWRDAAARREPTWAMLWIGHPWIAARFDCGRVILSTPHESSDPPDPPGDEAFSVDVTELTAAVERARLELVAFADALRPIVVARGHDPRVADVLAGRPAA